MLHSKKFINPRWADNRLKRYDSIRSLKEVKAALSSGLRGGDNCVLGRGGVKLLEEIGKLELSAPGVRWVLAGGAVFNALTGRWVGECGDVGSRSTAGAEIAAELGEARR